MSWRKILPTATGTPTMYSAKDMNDIMDLLDGIDTGKPVVVNNAWNFQNNPTGISITDKTMLPSDSIYATDSQTITGKTMDYNANTFLNFPFSTGGSGTGLPNAPNTWSALQTFRDMDFGLRNPANTFTLTFKNPTITADSTFQFNTEADYYIFIDTDDGNKYKARNGRTGAIDYVDAANADIVINGAINALTATGGPNNIASPGSTQGTSGALNNVWTGGRYGRILIGPGTFWVANSVVHQSNISIEGCGPYTTIIKLQASHPDNANSTVWKSANYDTRAYAAAVGRPDVGIRIAHMTIHGNGQNNATITTTPTSQVVGGHESAIQSWGFGIALYGCEGYRIEDVIVTHCAGAGICLTGPGSQAYSDGTYIGGANVDLRDIISVYNGRQGILFRGGWTYLDNFITAGNGEAGIEAHGCQYWGASWGKISNGISFLDGQNHSAETKTTYNPNAYQWRFTATSHWFIENCWVEGPAGPGDVILLGNKNANNTSFGTGFELGMECSWINMRNVFIDNCKYAGIRGASHAYRCNINATMEPNIETTWASSGNNPTQQALIWEGGAGSVLDVYIRGLPSPSDTTTHHCALTLGTATTVSSANDITIHTQACQYLINWMNAGNVENIIDIKNIQVTDHTTAALAVFDPNGATVDYTRNIINVQAATYDTSAYPITGLLSSNGGLATITTNGSTSTFPITHGLYTTPNVVNVMPQTADARGSFYVTASPTTITVNYAVAPPSGTNKLWWNARVNYQS